MSQHEEDVEQAGEPWPGGEGGGAGKTECASEAAEARRLLERLLGASPLRRPILARSPELASLPLAELLIAESLRAEPRDAERSEELARLAMAIAHQGHPRAEAARADSVKARACALAANARRRRQERSVAEEMFRQAAFYLTGPPEAPERAFFCQLLARLRREQGRLDEAEGCLWRAALIYCRRGEAHAEGLCLAELGSALFDEGELDRALPPLERAWEAVDARLAQEPALRAGLMLAVCHAERGDEARALDLVLRTRPLFGGEVAGNLPMLAWLDGRAALLTGRLEEARGLLETARHGFLSERRLHEAALATLDLALLAAEAGRLGRIHPLYHDLGQFFPLNLRLAGVLRVLDGFGLVALKGKDVDLRAAAATVAARLRRLRRNPSLTLEISATPAPPTLEGAGSPPSP